MKEKKILKIISGVLLFVIMFSGIFCLFTSADNTEPIYCVSDHFSKLKYDNNGVDKYRIPINETGTCTQVAMSMLLSFYDFYWHDQFVPTIYNSDGTYHQMGWENGIYNSTLNSVTETFNANPEAKAWLDYKKTDGNFENFASFNDMYYLHPYLMSLSDRETINDTIGMPGLLDFQVVQVLQQYLINRQLGPDKGVEVHVEYAFGSALTHEQARENIFNTIKEQINNGNPVIFMGLKIDIDPEDVNEQYFVLEGHAMIAYDVVTNGGKEDILLHTGWSNDDEGTDNDNYIDDGIQYFSSTEYQFLNSAVWIEIDETKLPHVCTKKYIDSEVHVPTKTYCACEIYPSHPAHSIHTYNGYECYNDNTHCYRCNCGYVTNVEPHNLSYSPFTSALHYETCSVCPYQSAKAHSYMPKAVGSSEYHNLVCACGSINGQEPHTVSRYIMVDDFYHNMICACGRTMGQATHNWVRSGLAYICRECGRRTTMLDGPILWKIEEDEEEQ